MRPRDHCFNSLEAKLWDTGIPARLGTPTLTEHLLSVSILLALYALCELTHMTFRRTPENGLPLFYRRKNSATCRRPIQLSEEI